MSLAAGAEARDTVATVAGYTTQKTREAGAASVRLNVRSPESGAHLVLLRARGCGGWLPGLAGTRGSRDGTPAVEAVVLGRSDVLFTSVMYLGEETLKELFPEGSDIEVRFVELLLPVQHDCPPQWLRDRLLRLADLVETKYASVPRGETLGDALIRAGLTFLKPSGRETALHADAGNRMSEEELGYWNEEMRLNTRCGALMNGTERLDYPSYGLDGQ